MEMSFSQTSASVLRLSHGSLIFTGQPLGSSGGAPMPKMLLPEPATRAVPARVHRHAGTIEAHRPVRRVQAKVAVTHLGEGRGDFRLVGQVTGPFIKPPNLHQRSHRDIERAFTLPAVLDAC